MSNANRVKERRLAAQAAAGVPSKRERRELGRKAAQDRMSARRRQILVRNGGGILIVLALIGVIVLAVKLTGGSTPTTSPTAAATVAPTPIVAPTDPALNTKPTVTKGTGKLTELKVTTLIAGSGPGVESGETLTVNYVGVNYATGEEFDSSWKSGKPFTTPIGTGKVIKGWDQGLLGVKIGSRVQLDIPADLAYGSGGSGPTSGDLRFVVDILSATPAS